MSGYHDFKSIEFQAHSLTEEAINYFLFSSSQKIENADFKTVYKDFREIFDFSVKNATEIEEKYKLKSLRYPVFKIIYDDLIKSKKQDSENTDLEMQKIITLISEGFDTFLKKCQETKKILNYETKLNFKNYLIPTESESEYYGDFIRSFQRLLDINKTKQEGSDFYFFTDELIFEINFYDFILKDYLLENNQVIYKEKNLFIKKITEQLSLKLKDKVKNNFNEKNFTNVYLNLKLGEYSKEIKLFIDFIKSRYSYEDITKNTSIEALKKESLLAKSVMQIDLYSDTRILENLWNIIENNELTVTEKNKNNIKIFLTEIIPEIHKYIKEDTNYEVIFEPDDEFYKKMNEMKNKLDGNFYKRIVDKITQISKEKKADQPNTLFLEDILPDTYKFLNGIE